MICPVFRSDNVARNPMADGAWVYFRQWRCADHAQDGTNCYFDMPESKLWPEESALAFALKQGWSESSDGFLLEAWRCGLMH